MGKLDSLGRATFHHIAAQSGVCPTNREIRWLKHIERHGPQSSVYLHELTKDTHRSQDQALRDLQKLRAGGFLLLPPQQRATERAEFNPYIYDLTRTAKRWLQDRGLAEPTIRPTGHWWHSYMVSCVTSSIDVAAARDGVRYIPAHEILARKGSTLGIPVNGKLLIPDQLFALDYGGSYRAFVLEVDRGTEPAMSASARKSLDQSLDLYGTVLRGDLLRFHYGLTAPVLVLWVFTHPPRAQWSADWLESLSGCRAPPILMKLVGWDEDRFRTPMMQFYDAPWRGTGTFTSIKRPAPNCATAAH